MNIGTDCSGITIGKVDVATSFNGPLTVSGAITSGANRNMFIGSSVDTSCVTINCGATTYINSTLIVNGILSSGPANTMTIAPGGGDIYLGNTSLAQTTYMNGSVKINGNLQYVKPTYANTGSGILPYVGGWFDVGAYQANNAQETTPGMIGNVYLTYAGIYSVSWTFTISFTATPQNNGFRCHITQAGVADGYWAINDYVVRGTGTCYYSGCTVVHLSNPAVGIGCFLDSGNTAKITCYTGQFKFRIARLA